MINKKEAIIIKYLIENKSYTTSQELANLLEVSSKTINRSIKSLNKILKSFNLEIVSSRGLGYKIHGAKEDINNVIQISKEQINGVSKGDCIENRIVSVIALLINKEYISVEKISEELNLSQASTVKVISKVKEAILKYDLSIKSKPCYGSYIVGEEKKIRLLIIKYLINMSENRTIKVSLDNINDKEIEILEKIISENLELNKLILSDKDFDLLISKFIIAISRTRKEHFIVNDYKIKDDNYLLISNMSKEIYTNLGVDLRDSEIYYILEYLEIILDSYSNIEDKLDKNIHEVLMNSLDEIYTISGNDYRKDQEFLKAMYEHIKRMLSRIIDDVRTINPIMSQIKNNLPMELNLAVLLGENIENEFNIELNENELAYIAIHFAVSSEKMKKERVKNICIVCNYGIGTGQLLAEKIKQNIKDVNILGVYPLRYIQNLITKDIDFIVSTVPISNIGNKVIYVDDIFSEDALKYIKNKVYEVKYKKEILKNMFDKDTFLKLKAKDKAGLIETVCENLIEKGYISIETKDKILAREKMSSTELGNLVAIPHTIMDENNKSLISAVVLDSPIIWDKKEVQIVFFLFFNKEEKENASVFRQLYNFVKDEYVVKRAIKACGFDEFIKIVCK